MGSTRCGKLSQAPVMVGANTLEWTLSAMMGQSLPDGDIQSTAKKMAQHVIDLYQSKKAVGTQDFTKLYPLKDYTKVTASLKKVNRKFTAKHAVRFALEDGDLAFNCATLYTSSAIASHTSRDAYLYLFDHWPSAPGTLGALGPTHTAEMPFVFGNFAWTPTSFEKRLSRKMMDYWLNFARYLNPNHPNSKATWPAAGYGEKNNFMVFKGPTVGG